MITRLAERTGSLLCPPDAGSSVAPHLCTFLRALGFGPEKTLTTGWGGGALLLTSFSIQQTQAPPKIG